MYYAIYTRQSVEKLDELTSCQVQFQTCKDFAEAEGTPHTCWIGEHFDDEGYSGMNLDRPGMTRLRELMRDQSCAARGRARRKPVRLGAVLAV